jgi:beta-lactamase regulating signal transducer with metallopeptidase domain
MDPASDFATLAALSGPALLALLDLAAKGTALLMGGILAAKALRGATASTRHLVLGVTFGCLLALPLLQPVVPSWEIAVLPAVSDLPGSLYLEGQPVDASEATSQPATPPALRRGLWATGALLLLGWTVGFAAVLLYFGFGSTHLHRISRRARRVTNADWLEAASAARRRLHLQRSIRLVQSEEVVVPMTWGALRPTILLPATADSWDAGLRRDVLLHELAHVKRQDYLIQNVVRAACALYWFNPLVWLAAAEIRQQRERACDDEVLRAGSPPSEYATHLLMVARALRGRAPMARASVAFARGPKFVRRVAALLDADRPHGSLGRWVAVPVYVAAGTLVLPLAALSPRASSTTSSECAGEAAAPRVTASFATGDIVETYFAEPSHFRLPEAVARGGSLISTRRGWCPVRFADPPGARRVEEAESSRVSGRAGRLSLQKVQKRPAPKLPVILSDLARLGVEEPNRTEDQV